MLENICICLQTQLYPRIVFSFSIKDWPNHCKWQTLFLQIHSFTVQLGKYLSMLSINCFPPTLKIWSTIFSICSIFLKKVPIDYISWPYFIWKFNMLHSLWLDIGWSSSIVTQHSSVLVHQQLRRLSSLEWLCVSLVYLDIDSLPNWICGW